MKSLRTLNIPFNFSLDFHSFLRPKVNFHTSRFIHACFVPLNKHLFTHSSMIDDAQLGTEITAACYIRKVFISDFKLMQFPQRWFMALKCNELCYVRRQCSGESQDGIFQAVHERCQTENRSSRNENILHTRALRSSKSFKITWSRSKVELSFYLKIQFEWNSNLWKRLKLLMQFIVGMFSFHSRLWAAAIPELMWFRRKFSLYQWTFILKILIEIPEGNIEWMCRWLLMFQSCSITVNTFTLLTNSLQQLSAFLLFIKFVFTRTWISKIAQNVRLSSFIRRSILKSLRTQKMNCFTRSCMMFAMYMTHYSRVRQQQWVERKEKPEKIEGQPVDAERNLRNKCKRERRRRSYQKWWCDAVKNYMNFGCSVDEGLFARHDVWVSCSFASFFSN